MLRKFKVSNFRSFEKEFVLDLTDVNGYEFNKSSIKENTVNHAIVYGKNGVGKSNLALALFDIITHLTDNQRSESDYSNYLNAFVQTGFAEFYFEFLINSKIVIYEYKKSDFKTIEYERFKINGIEYAYFDRNSGNIASIKFKGAENLKKEIESKELSLLKYIKNNTVLDQNEDNKIFEDFFVFIESMLYYRTLQDRRYSGFKVGRSDILEDIILKGNLEDFEVFLNFAGIECQLRIIENIDRKTIAFDFNGKSMLFNQVASSGTNALTVFYYWYQSIREKSTVSFLFIDEFDAFYHHELSCLVVEKLKATGVQFILTTHNTSIMSNDLLRPDCYFIMAKDNIQSLSKSTSKELREAHNIEKMYKAGAFNVK